MSRCLPIALLALLGAAGCVNASDVSAAANDDVTASDGDTHSVNGSIHVPEGAKRGEVTTVNGSITLGAGARVNATVTTVNGSLALHDDSQVGGAVRSVNGTIALTAAHVAGGLETVNGDINLRGTSRIEGGILVRKPEYSVFHWASSGPRIVIGPGATVAGSLRFEREVRLYVSDRATIGPVTGATPLRFSGEDPSG
jgi:cytoskeletal protein CcmA (bactofilin family)